MHRVWRLLRHGWRVVTEVHTAYWLIADVLVALLPPTVATVLADFLGEHSPALLIIVFCAVTAASTLILLAWLGYRREDKRAGEGLQIEGPDEWTIAELFYHICPDLERNRKDPDLREQTASKVLDALSSELVRMRGKRFDGARRLPLAWVDQSFWSKAKFTFWFLEIDDDVALHARNNELHIDYTGLRVSRSEALRIWPLPIPLREAARLAYEGTRGTAVAQYAERLEREGISILSTYENALYLYCSIYAQRAPSTISELLPLGMRAHMQLLPDGSGLRLHGAKTATYVDLRVPRAEVDTYIAEMRADPYSTALQGVLPGSGL